MLIRSILLLLLGAVAAMAQSVTVSDTLYLPNGTKYSGQLTISWPVPFTGGDGRQIPSGPPISTSVNNGVLSVALEANSTATPAGTFYQVVYRPAGSSAITEIWIVPCCSSPVNLSTVRVALPPSPSFMIALTQLAQGGATSGQCITWGGSAWAVGACGNLPNIVTPGTNTKITYNAQGLVTSAVQANFTDLAGSLQLTQTPLTTSQDILFDNAGSLGRLPISLVTNGACLGNSGGVWASLACSGGGGTGTVINDTPLPNGQLVIGGTAGGVHVTAGDLSGDISTSGSTATTLATVNSAIGTCGDSTHVSHITLNAKGQATACTAVAISGVSFPSASAQLQYLRIQPNTGNLTTTQFAGPFVFYPEDYAFTAQAPGGSLTGGGGTQTINLSPCPLGLNNSDTLHQVYLSGGTGTAEAKPITGGTCISGASSGTITLSPTNSHSGAWTVGPASAGIQEALVAASGSGVKLRDATYGVYGPIYVCQGTLTGAGMFNSILQIQTASVGAIDAPCQKDTFENFGITTASMTPGTSGNYGIRLGNGSGHDNSFTRINRLYFEPLYDAILCINCSQTSITNNVFYNFYHTAITANDTTGGDNDGPWIRGNVMFNYNSYSTPALACIYITSTGGITITDNNCYGSSALTSPQLQYNVYMNQTVSTQLTMKGNVFETVSVDNVALVGVFNLITITGNTIAQPQVAQSGWRGITISGNNTTSPCGSGIGICQVAITGNTIQGPGPSSSSSVCIELIGYISGAFIGGNPCNFSQIGVNIGSNVTATTVGQNQMSTYSTNVYGGSTGTTWDSPAAIVYSQLPVAANGSRFYVTNSNAGCTAGGSGGQWCELISGSWTH